MSKDICILLGAGFSRAVADMPTLDSVSKAVKEALEKSSHLSENFKKYIINSGNNQPWNYESCSELMANLRTIINNKDIAKYFFNSTDSSAHEQSMHAAEEIMYREVLNQLIKISMEKKHKDLRAAFEKLLIELTTNGHIVHIFDLNHDLVIDGLLNDPIKKFKYENFFRHYQGRAYALSKVPAGSGEKDLYFLEYRDNLMYRNESNIYHYKLHGSLNIAYLMGMPFGEKDQPKHFITGPHLALAYRSNKRPDYGTDTNKVLLKVFQEGNYKDEDGNEHRISSSVINQGNFKSQILTKDIIRYFPDCYSKFARLGDLGATLLSIGYGFRDSHINHIIQRHFDTEIYTAYPELHAAKILFSGNFDLPLLTESLNQIKHVDNGLIVNKHNRQVICSDQYFEKFIESMNSISSENQLTK